ncbi:330_t:CDS:1, partial [Funneliformis mosseae]
RGCQIQACVTISEMIIVAFSKANGGIRLLAGFLINSFDYYSFNGTVETKGFASQP